MWLELGRTLLASYLGSLGFAVILQAPRRSLLSASAIGSVSYLCYWALMRAFGVEGLAMFGGALIGSVLAQLAARRQHRVATIYVTIAIIPLVPGLGLYRCMQYLAQGNIGLGGRVGAQAMGSILMLALGITLGSFVSRTHARGREIL